MNLCTSQTPDKMSSFRFPLSQLTLSTQSDMCFLSLDLDREAPGEMDLCSPSSPRLSCLPSEVKLYSPQTPEETGQYSPLSVDLSCVVPGQLDLPSPLSLDLNCVVPARVGVCSPTELSFHTEPQTPDSDCFPQISARRASLRSPQTVKDVTLCSLSPPYDNPRSASPAAHVATFSFRRSVHRALCSPPAVPTMTPYASPLSPEEDSPCPFPTSPQAASPQHQGQTAQGSNSISSSSINSKASWNRQSTSLPLNPADLIREGQHPAIMPSKTVDVARTSTPYTDAARARKSAKNGHIKRPMNAFMIWAQQVRCKIIEQQPGSHNASISKILGSLWNEMDDCQKAPYREEADRLKQLHVKEFPEYKYKPRKPLGKRKVGTSDSSGSESTTENSERPQKKVAKKTAPQTRRKNSSRSRNSAACAKETSPHHATGTSTNTTTSTSTTTTATNVSDGRAATDSDRLSPLEAALQTPPRCMVASEMDSSRCVERLVLDGRIVGNSLKTAASDTDGNSVPLSAAQMPQVSGTSDGKTCQQPAPGVAHGDVSQQPPGVAHGDVSQQPPGVAHGEVSQQPACSLAHEDVCDQDSPEGADSPSPVSSITSSSTASPALSGSGSATAISGNSPSTSLLSPSPVSDTVSSEATGYADKPLPGYPMLAGLTSADIPDLQALFADEEELERVLANNSLTIDTHEATFISLLNYINC